METNMNYTDLVADFKSIWESAEKDQWRLAELAVLASSKHGGVSAFAKDVGRSPVTISKYIAAWKYREANLSREMDLNFADAYALAGMSEVRREAVRSLAAATGKPVNTVKSDTEAIKVVADFLTDNPDMLAEALKDDDARSAVTSAAFKAATSDVVATAEGITKEAADKKTPTTRRPANMKAVEIERLKFDVARAARENGLVSNRWERDLRSLADAMSADELQFVYDELAKIADNITRLRSFIDTERKARI